MNVPSGWTTMVWVRSSWPRTATLTMSSAPIEYSSSSSVARNGAALGAGVGNGVGAGAALVDAGGASVPLEDEGADSPAASPSRKTLSTPVKSLGFERDAPEAQTRTSPSGPASATRAPEAHATADCATCPVISGVLRTVPSAPVISMVYVTDCAFSR